MNILVTGASGQLGHDVVKELLARQIGCFGAGSADFDICDEGKTFGFIEEMRPDAVIHCAAYTAVDRAEQEPEKCYRVNVLGTRNVAAACERVGAKLVYVSTDYVFGGDGTAELETTAIKNPANIYGATKLEGENAALRLCSKTFVVRTSWVFGLNGKNFVKTMLRLGAEKQSISVVCDQTGSPTYTVDLARLLCDMVQTEKYGVYHASNEGFCSWAELALCVMRLSKLDAVIKPVSSSEYPSVAKRPMNSRLSKRSLDLNGFERLPLYENAVGRFLTELEEKHG